MFMLLAEETANNANVWAQWLTPQGVGAALGLLTSLLTVIALLLNIAGKKDLADKVVEAKNQTEAHKATVVAAVEMVRGVVQGVEAVKGGLDEASREKLVETIREVSKQAGAEAMLAPVVTAIQAGKTDTATLVATLNQVLGNLQKGAPPSA